jgi:hypothetical protein
MKRLALFGVLVLAGCGGSQQAETPAPHFPPSTAPLRTVIVGESGAPDAGGPIRAALLEGAPPAAPTVGTVLTDTNCEPDFSGISHCRNELRLDGGRKITVRHDHDMQRYSCLSPGEKVEILPA